MKMNNRNTDWAHDLWDRMPLDLTKDEFFNKARAMTRYLDHTKHYTEHEIRQAWHWYSITQFSTALRAVR